MATILRGVIWSGIAVLLCSAPSFAGEIYYPIDAQHCDSLKPLGKRCEANRFRSTHSLYANLPGGRVLVTVSGIVVTELSGKGGGQWSRETLHLWLKLPSRLKEELKATGKALKVQDWAPFVTLNAIGNRNHAIDSGWAVDEFSGPGPEKQLRDRFEVKASVATRDSDGELLRIGYNVSLQGQLVEYNPPSP